VDIHPPHGGIHSWRDFGLQLVTITAGVLIALSFDGIRESLHNRALVREARDNIRREIADNKREIDDEMSRVAGRGKQIDTALQFAHEMLKSKRSDIHRLELNLEFPTLSTASWQTAERTGALGHMDYAEVQKFATLYDFQGIIAAQHRRALDTVSTALGILADSDGGDPSTASAAELERFRQQLVALKSILFVEEQMSKTASERYTKALE
jgi:hypothetical protein